MNLKKVIRNGAAQLLFLTGLTSPARCGRKRLSIITFHRVLPEAERNAYPYPGLVVTPRELNTFLTYFTEYFDCGALATQHERYLSDNTHARPLLAITFDDAQYDNFCYARPMLAQHQVKASFFAPVMAVEQQELLWHDRLGFAILNMLHSSNSKNRLMQILAKAGISESNTSNLPSIAVRALKTFPLESRLSFVNKLSDASGASQTPEFARLMTFKELKELSSDGHEIGSHSMTHCMMPECDDRALAYEIIESRRILQAKIGQPIESFCYPNGNSDARTALAVAKAGYRRAVTTTWGSNKQDADHFQLCRYDMNARYVQDSRGKFMPSLLAFRMSGLYPTLT